MRTLLTVSALTAVGLYAVLSGLWVNHEPGWYQSLAKPAWQPPDWVFGVIWPLNFLALGAVSWWVTSHHSFATARLWVGVLALSVVFALAWAYLFYVPHQLPLAAASLTVAAVLTWGLWLIAANVGAWPAALLTPYSIWLSVASALAWAYSQLN